MYEWSDYQRTEDIMMSKIDVFPAFMKHRIVTEKDSKQMNTSIICTYIMWHGGKDTSAINENNVTHFSVWIFWGNKIMNGSLKKCQLSSNMSR